MWFMHFGSASIANDGTPVLSNALIDIVLISLFAVSHSVLLIPRIRRSFAHWMPASLYGCLFCLVSCLSLWSLMYWWRPLPGVWWQGEGFWWWAVMTLAVGAWILLGYSMWITGLGHQTGFTGLMAYWRPHQAQPRAFEIRGLYRFFRHPIYLSFLLIVWLTPVMSSGHLLLSVLMTFYLFFGSWLKDRRLVQLIGEPYQRYISTVPGYPGFPR